MNEPSFELGNAAAEAHLDLDQLAALCTAHTRTLTPEGPDARIARAELWGWVARYGCWTMIQDGMSSLDFDFWGWAMDKWEPAQRLAASSRFEQLLARASGGAEVTDPRTGAPASEAVRQASTTALPERARIVIVGVE